MITVIRLVFFYYFLFLMLSLVCVIVCNIRAQHNLLYWSAARTDCQFHSVPQETPDKLPAGSSAGGPAVRHPSSPEEREEGKARERSRRGGATRQKSTRQRTHGLGQGQERGAARQREERQRNHTSYY